MGISSSYRPMRSGNGGGGERESDTAVSRLSSYHCDQGPQASIRMLPEATEAGRVVQRHEETALQSESAKHTLEHWPVAPQ
jgi:hypothetical protein